MKKDVTEYVNIKGIKSLLQKIRVGGFSQEPIHHHTKFLLSKSSNTERIYCIINDIISIVLCQFCNKNKVTFIDYKNGYRRTCSSSCSARLNAKLRPPSESVKSGKSKSGICKICDEYFIALKYHVTHEHNVSYGDYDIKYNDTPLDNYVECMICHQWHAHLSSHLKIHNVSVNKYKELHPHAKILNSKDAEKQSQKISGTNNHMHHTRTSDEFRKRCSPYNIEFWKGKHPNKTNEELEKMRSEFLESASKKGRDNSNTKISYWINKGFSEEEAKELLSERQNTMSYDKLVKKHGVEEAMSKYKKYRNKISKSTIENGSLFGSSKIANNLFKLIIEKSKIEKFQYDKFNGEYHIAANNSFYHYDFTHFPSKSIIEFNGTIFHGDPRMYGPNSTPNPYTKNKTAKQIWSRDREKIDVALSRGFKILVVWEADYIKDPEYWLDLCIQFITDKYKY